MTNTNLPPHPDEVIAKLELFELFAGILKYYASKSGLQDGEIAKLAGFSAPLYSSWVNNHKLPSHSGYISDLCKVMKLDRVEGYILWKAYKAQKEVQDVIDLLKHQRGDPQPGIDGMELASILFANIQNLLSNADFGDGWSSPEF